MKICKDCLEEKSLDEFSKHQSTKDGLRNSCKKCRRLEAKKYREENRDKEIERHRKYKEENKEKIKKSSQNYYVENKDIILKKNNKWKKDNPKLRKKHNEEWNKNNKNKRCRISKDYRIRNSEKVKILYNKWRKANPERIKEIKEKRRAIKINATPIWYEFQREEIQAIYKEARELTIKTGILHHVDHIYPLKPRKKIDPVGLHVVANLQILTAEENVKKSNFQPQEWEKRKYLS